jgi:hypothetical protein
MQCYGKAESNFTERERKYKNYCEGNRIQYTAPTNVQFDVVTYNDLNSENKMKKVIKYMSVSEEILLGEIKKYDTSILDHHIQHFEG